MTEEQEKELISKIWDKSILDTESIWFINKCIKEERERIVNEIETIINIKSWTDETNVSLMFSDDIKDKLQELKTN